MEDKNLIRMVERFINAIEITKEERCFYDLKDRMYKYPFGCCDDTSELFAFFLKEKKYNKSIKEMRGYYEDDVGNGCHVWLKIEGVVVDLTFKQFSKNRTYYYGEYQEYIKLINFYQVEEIPIYDISNNERLKSDYDAILKHF